MLLARKPSSKPPELNTKDPKVRADLYMASHGMTELFEGLGTLLLYNRPSNPREFLIQQLGELRKAKQEQGYVLMHDLPFFEEHDLKAICLQLLTSRNKAILPQRNTIEVQHCSNDIDSVIDGPNFPVVPTALHNLGIDKPTLRLPESVTTINQVLFIRSMSQEIKNASASFM